MISVINRRQQHQPGPRHDPGVRVVYIGRPSIFGNPVKIGQRCPECGRVHADRGSTLPCYKKYLWRRMQTDPGFRRALDKLVNLHHGGHLLLECWCHPHPCHGDVLRDAVRWLSSGEITGVSVLSTQSIQSEVSNV